MDEIRKLPEQNERVETGSVQFGDDWPGVFIRGDNAAYWSFCLRLILDEFGDSMDVLTRVGLSDLAETLESSFVGSEIKKCFENLRSVIDDIKHGRPPTDDPELIKLAEEAAKSQQEPDDETVEEWAERIAKEMMEYDD